MKGYLNLEELKKDYPIGKIEIEGPEQTYSCSKNSSSFKSFVNFYEHHPLLVNKIENENGITYTIKGIILLYEIVDYVYIASVSKWFPVEGRMQSKISIYDYINDFYSLPSSYKDIKQKIKEQDYTIYQEINYND